MGPCKLCCMSYHMEVARELALQNLNETSVPSFWKIVNTAIEWGLEIELTTKSFRDMPSNVFPIYNGSLFFIGRSRSCAVCVLNDDASSRVAGRLSMHDNLVRYNHVSNVNNYYVKHDGEFKKMLHCDGKDGSPESSVNLDLGTVIRFSNSDGVKTSFELRLNTAVKATLVRCMQEVMTTGDGDLECVLSLLRPDDVDAPMPVFQPMPTCRLSDPRDYLTHEWLSTIRLRHLVKRKREAGTLTDAEVMTDDIETFAYNLHELAKTDNPEGTRVFKRTMLLKFHPDKRFDDSEEMRTHARCMLEKVRKIVV